MKPLLFNKHLYQTRCGLTARGQSRFTLIAGNVWLHFIPSGLDHTSLVVSRAILDLFPLIFFPPTRTICDLYVVRPYIPTGVSSSVHDERSTEEMKIIDLTRGLQAASIDVQSVM